jgi:hypothetical protein
MITPVRRPRGGTFWLLVAAGLCACLAFVVGWALWLAVRHRSGWTDADKGTVVVLGASIAVGAGTLFGGPFFSQWLGERRERSGHASTVPSGGQSAQGDNNLQLQRVDRSIVNINLNGAAQLLERKHEARGLRFNLPRKVAHFVGREELLVELHAALGAKRAGVVTQCISGLGGVGKTQLVAAYVEAHGDELDIVAWVRASDGGTEDLAGLARALGLQVAGLTPGEQASAVLAYLANTDRSWLLVLDNVTGPEALIGLPNSGRGRVLVTSRHRGGYHDFGTELAVDVFDAATARKYLLGRSGRGQDEAAAADGVAAALGYLPLALAHAGAHCEKAQGRPPFEDYLRFLEGLPAQELFDDNPEAFYEQTVAATWGSSVLAAERTAPLARAALEMTAYLAPEPVPRCFFRTLADTSTAGQKRVDDAVAALHSYSLVNATGDAVSVHRLVQKVVRDRLAADGQQAAARHAVEAVSHAAPAHPDLPENWPRWSALAPHVTALSSCLSVLGPLDRARGIGLLNATCEFFLEAGVTDRALGLAQRAEEMSRALLDPDHPEALDARAMLAKCYRVTRRTDQAVSAGEAVVADYLRVLGPDDRRSLEARASLASSYRSAGLTDEAIVAGEAVVADSIERLGPDHPGTIKARACLAAAYRRAGRTDQAVAAGEAVVADYLRVLGPDHPCALEARSRLAASYRSEGRSDEAIATGEAVVADSTERLGPDHPGTLNALADLALSYQSVGRTAEAVAAGEAVVADRARLVGPEHPDTLTARAALASFYRSAGRTKQAIAVEKELRDLTATSSIATSSIADVQRAR